MNNQEIFDKVADHLLTQNEKAFQTSEDNEDKYDGCMYRTPEGLKCAIGCLIPDEIYEKNMEGAVPPLLFSFYEYKEDDYGENMAEMMSRILRDSGIEEENLELLKELQNTHDSINVENWPIRLKRNAEEFGLVYNQKGS